VGVVGIFFTPLNDIDFSFWLSALWGTAKALQWTAKRYPTRFGWETRVPNLNSGHHRFKSRSGHWLVLFSAEVPEFIYQYVLGYACIISICLLPVEVFNLIVFNMINLFFYSLAPPNSVRYGFMKTMLKESNPAQVFFIRVDNKKF